MLKLTDPLIEESIENLKEYISFPSVSAKNQSINETANFLKKLFDNLGAEVQTLDDYSKPLVYAELIPEEPTNKTILIYDHYDVQPEEPVELWDSDPFELKITKDKFIARGVSDCKADLISRITALKLYKQENGDWPCNIKFVIEGGEEIASENLEEYLKKYSSLFSADLVIWESGIKNENEQFSFNGGNKGIVCFELEVISASTDLHSSFAAVVDSASWRLTEALSLLRSSNGEILIPGFYDDVLDPSDREKELVDNTIAPDFKSKWDLKTDLLKNSSINYNLAFSSTINIEGISTGWEGEGVKTVTPKKAIAKLECRLVPDQDPKDIFNKINAYLSENGFEDVKATYLMGEKSYRWDLDSKITNKLIETAVNYYGGKDKVEVLPSSPGTGPMHLVNQYTKAPIVSCGVSYFQANNHAPNENIRINDYLEFIEFFENFLTEVKGI
ncbi:M20/M25/M40 family metallo-hydrolase [Lactobacillus terrae]|uniref:M20/M25/M40 family metallo-hydrolase n=1 Tax=Lactobacillus terrae TaxID=2269374 RepID=UPI000C1B682F|nr:M20/M25/M40 family metallo-hydrolase [Lactobacillus terrae]